MFPTDGAQEQPCPGCGRAVSTAGLEPFSKVSCPACGYQLRVERVFENYQVVEPLGTGGMGSVFKARDTRLNRFIALKLLRREFAGDESFTAKLLEEARITASIKHPHVLEVFSVGEDHGQFYVVMELVDGGSLDDRMEDEKRIPELRTLEVGLQVAKGLQAALKAGLIHRDIKPGNILFADAQTAKIVDFGLALLAEQHAESEGGEIWGTPYYVAPERLTGTPEDFRSDLYSLGATLFHAIAGRPTFESETLSAMELKKLKASAVPLQEVAPDVSDETAAIIDRMLRPEPADRQGSYKELIDQLEAARAAAIAREEELRGRWSWPVRLLVSLGALLLAAGVVAGIVFGLRHLPRKSARPVASAIVTATPSLEAIGAARQELEAGHYGQAEALFRELAANAPGLEPMAGLCAALQVWEHDDFAQAATKLQHFLETKAAAPFPWIGEYRPLAQDRLHDYQLFTNWEKTRSTLPNDPEKALEQIHEVSAKLKTKGSLSFRLGDEEAALRAKADETAARRAAEEKKLAAAEAPRWQAARTAARKAMAAYQFDAAVGALKNVRLTSSALEAERAVAVQRAQWLADWKSKLLADINGTGFGGAVTDIHGVRYDGPVRRASASEMELKTRYGRVMVRWLNLSPQMLLTMSTAFIRPGVRDVAERRWLSAIFAAQTGQIKAASDLAQKAAAAKPEFRDLLPRFFPHATK